MGSTGLKGNRRRSISLALGSGGARGFAHIGVIQELTKAGITIEELAGTSMGAVIAAYYAVHQHLEEPTWLAQSLTKKKMLHYLDPVLPKESLIAGKRFRELLYGWFGKLRIEDTKIPLSIVATNLRTGEAKIFTKGPLIETLLASSAIPGLLPAVKLRNEYYVDGGLVAQVPWKALRKRGSVKVGVELPLGKQHSFKKRPSIVDVLSSAYAIGRERGQEAPEEGTITLRPNVGTFQETMSFHKSKEFITNGAKEARRMLSFIEKAL